MRYLILLLVFSFFSEAYGQQMPLLSQYYKSGPLINPAFSGVNGFMNINAGYRQQWAGLPNAPRTIYLTANGMIMNPKSDKISNTLRISDPSLLEEEEVYRRRDNIKMGWGFYAMSDSYGPFDIFSGFANYAFHYPISRSIYLSLGAGGGINNTTIDMNSIEVRDGDNDQTYQNFLANGGTDTRIDVNVGAMLYSDRFFIGYSIFQLLQEEILVSDAANAMGLMHQYITAGLRLQTGESMMIIPSIVYRDIENLPRTIDYSFKALFNNSFYTGFSYRDDNSIILTTGMTIQNNYTLGYSYDYKFSGVNNFNNGSHEIVLGLMLFNDDGTSPYLW